MHGLGVIRYCCIYPGFRGLGSDTIDLSQDGMLAGAFWLMDFLL